jgi:hypothetical protein
LLNHLKGLAIKNKKICYQVHSGIRQRKNTVHPKRWLKKYFETTATLLEYLETKFYVVQNLDIEFTNGWRVIEQPHVAYNFYTNSTKERDNLIHKLMVISGQGPIDLLSLEENITYYSSGADVFEKMFEDQMPSPDEFWSEERREAWKKAYIAKHYKEETQEEYPEDKGNSFISTMNINLDSTSTESDKAPWNNDNDKIPW